MWYWSMPTLLEQSRTYMRWSRAGVPGAPQPSGRLDLEQYKIRARGIDVDPEMACKAPCNQRTSPISRLRAWW